MKNRELARAGQEFQGALEGTRRPKGGVQASFRAIRAFERLAGEVYAIRQNPTTPEEVRYFAEDLLASASQELIFAEGGATPRRAREPWKARYRRVWRENLSLLVFTTVLFVASMLVGWIFAAERPEYAPVLIPQQMLEVVLDHKAWFARIQDNPLLYGAAIAANNIGVCIKTFAAGALIGLGGVVLLCFNGISFGSLFGYCYANAFHEPLQIFVLSHGPLELSIIVASAFASLLYGRAFFMRPLKSFPSNIARGAADAFVVMLGITPWLVLAATFEAFVSPFEFIPPGVKVVLGLLAGGAFWSWTFWPERGEGESPS